MIEVCDEKIWYKKRRKRIKSKSVIVFFIVLFFLTCGFLYYKNMITKQVLKICADYSETIATESVNKAVISTLKEQIKYSDLVYIEKNSAGDIALMTANSYKINSLSREIANKSVENLNKKLDDGIPVPLLSFSGISILSGYGSKVNYKAVYISNVICEFSSTFESVGINQTLHSIYIDVKTEIKLEMPANTLSRKCTNSVLVSEAIIVGKVPEVYLNGKLF